MNFAELFNRSFEENIHGNDEVFFSRFYENFMSISPQVSEVFQGVDLQRQIDMLEHSLLLLVDFSVHRQGSESLIQLASVHMRAGVTAEMYDWWLTALIRTLEQLDTKFRHPEVLAWRVTLAPGIEFMKNFNPYSLEAN